jgi:FkbM family methyltransferase
MLSTLLGITRHPLNRRRPLAAVRRFLAWQIGTRMLDAAVAMPFAGDTRLLVRRGMTGASGNIYCGLHEFEDMAFVLHVLRQGDVFIDVGANVGSYTILAAGVCKAQCISLEPVPKTFAHLLANVRLNDLESLVSCRNVAAGSAAGTVQFTSGLDTVNHVVAEDEQVGDAVSVPVDTLDGILRGVSATVIKIDVEGFESQVLDGSGETLRSSSLLAVLMEINGSGNRYGFNDDLLRERMESLGFTTAAYDPISRSLQPCRVNGQRAGNALFVRDWNQVRERLASAPKVRVLDTAL